MPKRSNLFQKLVLSVQQGFGPGWTITESEMLQDFRIDRAREVDIVVRGSINGHEIVFGIECRDHRRPADVTWIEQMAKKHEGLEVTNLILWSASGFSEAALLLAEKLKIETVSQRDASEIPWAEMARHVAQGSFQYVEPSYTASVDVEQPSGEKERFALTPSMFLIPSGTNDIEITDRYYLLTVLEQIKHSPELGNTLLDHAPEGAGDFHVIYSLAMPCHVMDDDGRIDLGSFMRMVVGVRTVSGKVPVDARSVMLDGVVHTLGAATTMGFKYEIQVQEREAQKPEVVIRKLPHSKKS